MTSSSRRKQSSRRNVRGRGVGFLFPPKSMDLPPESRSRFNGGMEVVLPPVGVVLFEGLSSLSSLNFMPCCFFCFFLVGGLCVMETIHFFSGIWFCRTSLAGRFPFKHGSQTISSDRQRHCSSDSPNREIESHPLTIPGNVIVTVYLH